MEFLYINNEMTCKVVTATNPYEGHKFRLALVHLCDGQTYSWVVCSGLSLAHNVKGKSLCQWNQGRYFETLHEAKVAFAQAFLEL